jgi:hypothetical protein
MSTEIAVTREVSAAPLDALSTVIKALLPLEAEDRRRVLIAASVFTGWALPETLIERLNQQVEDDIPF